MPLAVQGGDGRLGFLIGTHLHETETLAAAGLAVGDDFRLLDLAMLGEQLLEVRAGHAIAEITDIQPTAHLRSPRRWALRSPVFHSPGDSKGATLGPNW